MTVYDARPPEHAWVAYLPSRVDVDVAHLAARMRVAPEELVARAPWLRALGPRRFAGALPPDPTVMLPLTPQQFVMRYARPAVNVATLAVLCDTENRAQHRVGMVPLTAVEVWHHPLNAAFRKRQMELYLARHAAEFPDEATVGLWVAEVDADPGLFALQEVVAARQEVGGLYLPHDPLWGLRTVPLCPGEAAVVSLESRWMSWLVAELQEIEQRTGALRRCADAVDAALRKHGSRAATAKHAHDLTDIMGHLATRHQRETAGVAPLRDALRVLGRELSGEGTGRSFMALHRQTVSARDATATELFERVRTAPLREALRQLHDDLVRPVRQGDMTSTLALHVATVLTRACTQLARVPARADAVCRWFLQAIPALRGDAIAGDEPLITACRAVAAVCEHPEPLDLGEAASVVPAAQSTEALIAAAVTQIVAASAEFVGPPSLATHLLSVVTVARSNTREFLRAAAQREGAVAAPTFDRLFGQDVGQALATWREITRLEGDESVALLNNLRAHFAPEQVTTLRARIESYRALRDVTMQRSPALFNVLNRMALLASAFAAYSQIADIASSSHRMRPDELMALLGGPGTTTVAGVVTVVRTTQEAEPAVGSFLTEVARAGMTSAPALEFLTGALAGISAGAMACHAWTVWQSDEHIGAVVELANAALGVGLLAPPPFDILCAVALAASAVTSLNPRFWQEVVHPEPAWHAVWGLLDAIWNDDDVAALRDRDAHHPLIVSLHAARQRMADTTFATFEPGDPDRADAWNALRGRGIDTSSRSFILGPRRSHLMQHLADAAEQHPSAATGALP